MEKTLQNSDMREMGYEFVEETKEAKETKARGGRPKKKE